MAIIIKTERLILREITTSDWEFIIELLNTKGWIKYIGDRNMKDQKSALTYIEVILNGYKTNGFGLWIVETNNTSIGMCGIIKRDTLENPDIGFAFLPAYEGQGFAFESANATILFAKEKLNLSTILGITVPNNLNSIKLLKKIGLKYVKTFRMPNSKEELQLFST